MTSVADIINTLNNRFDSDAADDLNATFQFSIEDGDDYYITIKDGTCTVGEGENDDADVTLVMNTETFAGIASGETDGMQAFMSGQLRVEGDMMLATKIGELFPA
ncbi:MULTISPECIES: SCP2 sterol-binding domain-containing protein [Oceanospirillaceae]|jgi:putative sterol carrier protein|uniref:SCP2 sterol-binding domain-containing protein n=1 Tax=Oceanobacter antarcticus TaxID=3133425 RepID=A0ABW8NHR1_9GAMM|tara:strand:- start:2511 stop:2825 length:315 start_codon:yes stop_codon:yes gene_type:complete